MGLRSPALQADSLPAESQGKEWGAQNGGMGRSIVLEGACEEATEDREECSDVDGARACHTK